MNGTMRCMGVAAISIFFLLSTQSCKHDPFGIVVDIPGIDTGTNVIQDPCDPDSIYFENDVLPILVSNCAISGCHDPEEHEEGIILSSYEDVMNSDVIENGDPFDSEMIEKILDDDLDDRMPPPPNAPLSSDEVNILIAWIEQGALNNGCEDCDTAAITYSGTISPIINSYCLGCHSGSEPSGEIDLSTYGGVLDVAESGQLEGALNGYSGFTQMPFGSDPLPQCKIDQIVTWIESGSLNN
ncbi:MAG: hypothetical protein H7Y00_15825 [Fimbriimonadaceae bacterium]|nr:hypothetical protein [Chitinophagales bacterium]